MTNGTHWLRIALLALLALALLSGGSLAAGDLFDDDYRDCPAKTRLREGQIADLTVSRDAEEADEVNIAWAATDPATWGLGANTYSTSLVVLLDDGGDLEAQTLSLGTRKATFTGVAAGTEVKVQMAIVVDTAEGDYLISDILETTVNQSLTAPAFYGKFMQVAIADVLTTTAINEQTFRDVPGGTFYYVGYNWRFGNYKATGLTTRPSTPRLRIGLVHGGENDDAREAVDFEAYRMRITDGSGDVVPEGNDVATVMSPSVYESVYRANTHSNTLDLLTWPVIQLVLQFGSDTAGSLADNELMFSNVRINDGGNIVPALQNAPAAERPISLFTETGVSPASLSPVMIEEVRITSIGRVFTMIPDEHRDFPDDVLSSDETYTVTAWAVNDAGTVISPVASLKLRPKDTATNITSITDQDNSNTTVSDVILTEFTVLK